MTSITQLFDVLNPPSFSLITVGRVGAVLPVSGMVIFRGRRQAGVLFDPGAASHAVTLSGDLP